MLSRVIILIASFVMVVSCAKKPVQSDKDGQVTGEPTAIQDSNIANKDLSFDPQGSDSGNINGLVTVYFDYDKAALSQSTRDALAKDYQWIKDHAGVTLQVEGHCDSKGSIEYNLALGERRAKAVKQYLTQLGADASKLTIISYGKEKPLDSSGTEAGEAKNRRANFVIVK